MDISLNPGPERCQSDGLRALYLNARSLKAYVASDDSRTRRICKITILQELVYSGDFDVVGICETWLNESVIDNEIIPGYSIFRRDREDLGGGVIVAVKGNIQASRRFDLEREDTELVVVELKRCHEKSVLLYCFYHPNASPDPILKLNSSLCDNCESACIIVFGDFNLPELDWSDDQTAPINNGSRAEHNLFCDLMDDNFLHQFIPGPTHLAGNKLDLLLCNWPEVIGSVRSFHPRDGLFPSDHYVVEFEIILKFKRAKRVTRQFYDFKNGNFDDLRDSLTRLPFDVATSADVNEHWSNWKDLFLTAVKEHIPIKTVGDKNSPPWIDGEVRHLIRKKYAALKKFRLNKSPERKLKLRKLSQNIKYLVRSKHRQYLAKIEASFKDNPKEFWSYHKVFMGGRSCTNSSICYDGEVATKPAQKAELLNKYFCSVFLSATPDVNIDPTNNSPRTDMEISQIQVSVDDVTNHLNGLDTSKACGPDGISARLLKECSQQIAPSLCGIFNQSLSSGQIPTEWKSADITPIHKKDSKEPAENYRPISLLPIVSKVLERCVFNCLYDHVNNLITPLQHGFLRNRSCVTQLLPVLHTIGQNLDKNIQTDVIYLDFAKAFDTVDHNVLLSKLRAYGVSGQLLTWFANYLSGRLQRVVIDGATSQWAPVTSGVPQGSLLGPLLFVIFIKDLPDVAVGDVFRRLYADDTKVYRNINTFDDCMSMQKTLTNMDTWTRDNNIRFNASKCKALTINRKKSPLNFIYKLDNVELERVSTEKDVGVNITNSLTWNTHIYSITTKANKLLGLLKRTCHY